MYSYYALRAFGFRLPKALAMVITASQIIQMVVGCYVTYYGIVVQAEGKFCQITEGTAKLGLVMYGSYFVLFAHFFVKSYFAKASEKRQSTLSDAKSEAKQVSMKKRVLKAE
ncbi:elongation of very long chain fatty acids protein 6-like protein [Leptotrombidium deliense]|uniref:Elongation of very long chain fatty acids protein n=1 Tax=Leptotrombidium deliense TaxID=299467 RepID=A0A443SHL6_9ACAR|nr:elongation of very long chain fatty acids protein 6-like protein [Leptotrombidium deliense]